MTEPHRPPKRQKRRATKDLSQPLDTALEALVKQRTAAVEEENARLRAELQAQQQVEATLRQREEQFNALINNVPGAVYRAAFDDDWTIAFISDAIAHLTGYPAADFIHNAAQSFNTICHPDDLARVNQGIRAAVAAKQPFVLEYRMMRADGQIIWVCEQGHGVYGANDEGLWLDGVLLDITALKQTEVSLRRSEERLNLITDAMPVCLSYVDRDQHLQMVNKTYETWFGRPMADMQGRHLSEVLGEAAYQVIHGFVAHALAGEITTYEVELPYQWGGSRYISAVLIPDIDSHQQVRGYYAFIMDVSAQQVILRERQQAEALAKQQAERERLLNVIAQRIRQSLDLDHILNTTVQEVRLLLQADRSLIYRFLPDQTGIILVESVGNPWQSLLGEVFRDERLTVEAFQQWQEQGRTIIADIDNAGLEAFYVEIFAQRQIRAIMLLPLTVGNHLWGFPRGAPM